MSNLFTYWTQSDLDWWQNGVIAQVLLGDGLYAERSAKQAAEILMRRSEFMDSKINAIKGQIKDLQAEAAFATNTAAEAAVSVCDFINHCCYIIDFNSYLYYFLSLVIRCSTLKLSAVFYQVLLKKSNQNPVYSLLEWNIVALMNTMYNI